MGVAIDFLEATLSAPSIKACIRWPYATDGNGYAKMGGTRRTIAVHRHICRVINGAPPDGTRDASHTCGVKICVNPAHIEWKSHADNMADKITHGKTNRGERQGNATLTCRDVREIRQLMGPPGARYKADSRKLAKRFGVDRGTIYQIARREKWAWLDKE